MTVSLFSGIRSRDGDERVRGAERVLRPSVERALYSRHMRALLVAAAIAIAVAASAFADTARSGSAKERRYFSARHGIGVEAPPGWTLSQHTGYPTVLVALVHPGGSRISIGMRRNLVKNASTCGLNSRHAISSVSAT